MRVNYLGTVFGCQRRGARDDPAGARGDHQRLVDRRPSRAAHGGRVRRHQGGADQPDRSLRVELRGTGVHACSVHPVGTETEFGEVQARLSGDAAPRPLGPQQSAQAVAEAIVRCAERPRAEVYPYWPSRAIVWLNALAPGVVDFLSARAARRPDGCVGRRPDSGLLADADDVVVGADEDLAVRDGGGGHAALAHGVAREHASAAVPPGGRSSRRSR